MRYQRTIWVGLGLAACAVTLTGQETASDRSAGGRRLVVAFDEGVYDELARLASTARRETVRCLIGTFAGDTALIEIAWKPRIDQSSAMHVQYRGCPRSAVAKWHNHLAWIAPTPLQACFLSGVDIEDGLVPGAPLLQFVQVNRDVLCWWHRGQLAAAEGQPRLAALPAQVTTLGIGDGTPATVASAAKAAAQPRP
jgi:hypothetical protein